MEFNFKLEGEPMKHTNYNTKQKTAIMDTVNSIGDKHFTIDDICTLLSKNGINIGRTTVYRRLESLNRDGTLQKFVMPQGDNTCYQYVGEHGNCSKHFHFKCEKCGGLIHTECDELNDIIEHIKNQHGFVFDPFKTVIYGVCEKCASK